MLIILAPYILLIMHYIYSFSSFHHRVTTGEADARDWRRHDARRPIRAHRYELVLVQQDIQGDAEDPQEGVKKTRVFGRRRRASFCKIYGL